MLTSRPRGARRDEGFTLVELVVTVAIMGIIITALVGSMLFMLSAKQRTSEQVATSADRQIVASYFASDVEGASGPTPLRTGAATVCSSAVTSVFTVAGTDYDPGTFAPVATAVAYVWSSSTKELKRMTCRGSAGPVMTQTIARSVSAAPSVSASCTTSTALTATSRTVSLVVPEAGDPSIVLCARRRAQ